MKPINEIEPIYMILKMKSSGMKNILTILAQKHLPETCLMRRNDNINIYLVYSLLCHWQKNSGIIDLKEICKECGRCHNC